MFQYIFNANKPNRLSEKCQISFSPLCWRKYRQFKDTGQYFCRHENNYTFKIKTENKNEQNNKLNKKPLQKQYSLPYQVVRKNKLYFTSHLYTIPTYTPSHSTDDKGSGIKTARLFNFNTVRVIIILY